MYCFVLSCLCLFVISVICDPELVRDNDFSSYAPNDGTGLDSLGSSNYYEASDVPLKPKEIKDWPRQFLNVGQITAVSVNSRGQPVIFHRAQRVWSESSFNESNVYQHYNDGPIMEETVLVLDPHTGSIVDSWGGGSFYMPHGLTVDHHDNVWLTDVAMHQVFKYTPNSRKPILTIGKAFRAGVPSKRLLLLCMPTSVAVAKTGEIFVADGYCNNQILKFNAAGVLLNVLPRYAESISLDVPHSLTLVENLDYVCVADRENMRIVCMSAGIKSFIDTFDPSVLVQDSYLGRVFAVASHGDMLYMVNGPTAQTIPVRGFIASAKYGNILDIWEPSAGLTNPHSVAITRNGSHMYVTEIGPNKIWKFELVNVTE